MPNEILIETPTISSRFLAGSEQTLHYAQQVTPGTIAGGACGMQYSLGWDGGPWVTAPTVAARTTEPVACDPAQYTDQGSAPGEFPFRMYGTAWVRMGVFADQGLTGDPEITNSNPLWYGVIEHGDALAEAQGAQGGQGEEEV